MKKYLTIILWSFIILSCEKNVIGDFDGITADPILSEDGQPLISEAAKLTKKGAAYTNKARAWSHKTSALGAHWMYSWGNILREEIPENVEYVPMFWGKGSVTEENLARVKQYIDEGKVKYVLGFNEPDGADQANMSPDEAIELWPQLESLGVPLGSPAVVGFNNSWLQEFMQKAEEKGLRVDFITVHSYGGPNVLNLIGNLKTVYNAYKKPLWITEFAVADWQASTPEENRHSEETVQEFMTQALSALDDIDWVHRYAWFDGGGRAPLVTSELFDEEANITTLGQIYANNKPNLLIGSGQDTPFDDPSSIYQDHENSSVSDAGGSLGYQLAGGSSSVEIGTGTGNSTKVLKAVHAAGGNEDLYVRTRTITVEEGDVYTLKYDISLTNAVHTLRLRLSNGDVAPFTVISPDNVTTTNGTPDAVNIGKINASTPNQFGTVTATFTIPAGFNSARFQIYQFGDSNTFELDNVIAQK